MNKIGTRANKQIIAMQENKLEKLKNEVENQNKTQ
jgi:hypothetical protein